MTISLVSMNAEHASPEFVKDFKASMALNAAAVAIICCEYEGRRYGLAATSVTSLSVDPPSILICVGQNAEAHDPIQNAGRFSVSFLARGQQRVSDRFAGFGGARNEQKFEGSKWLRGALQMPILEDAAFAVECEIAESYKIMTHTLHAGAVRSIWQNGETRPLVYYNRKYVDLVD
jgi:flavin reductase (DIM6/NTAB) family NADH-FMN oxidoreductase RutF